MESLPLIPKSNIYPNLDVTPLVRELFQNELETEVPSQRVLQKFRDGRSRPNWPNEPDRSVTETDDALEFAKKACLAYSRHEASLEEIKQAEMDIMRSRAVYLKREDFIRQHDPILDMLKLKRQPLFQSLDPVHVKKYNLIEGEAGLPIRHEANLDFRLKKYKSWKERVKSVSKDSLIDNVLRRKLPPIDEFRKHFDIKRPASPKKKPCGDGFKFASRKPKRMKTHRGVPLRSEPSELIFRDFAPGYIYMTDLIVTNVSYKPVTFRLEPMVPTCPFQVAFHKEKVTRIWPGMSFRLNVEFTPLNKDEQIGYVKLLVENGSGLTIPMTACLEDPLLKTHESVNEYSKSVQDRIAASYIELGTVFTGNQINEVIEFRSYGGGGSFFIMSMDNWLTGCVDTVSEDYELLLPPFVVDVVYFKLEKHDKGYYIQVTCNPEESGTQAETIAILCDNGEVRFLDLLAEAVSWHSYYITIEDSLLKNFDVDFDDEVKVRYYLDMGKTGRTGQLEKRFSLANHSDLYLGFQWEIRNAEIAPPSNKKYQKLEKNWVFVEPSYGGSYRKPLVPNEKREFHVGVNLVDAKVGHYRAVISLYIVNLPFACLEEDNTIIRPTRHRRNTWSDECVEEEEEEEEGENEKKHEEKSISQPSRQSTYGEVSRNLKSQSSSEESKIMEYPGETGIAHIMKDERWCCLSKSTDSTVYDSDGCPVKMFDTDYCALSEKTESDVCFPNTSMWERVDVLVDEIELWAEVAPTRVTLQPSVIDCGKLRLNDPPFQHQVHIINHNAAPISCKWFSTAEYSFDVDYEDLPKTDGDEDKCACLRKGSFVLSEKSSATNQVKCSCCRTARKGSTMDKNFHSVSKASFSGQESSYYGLAQFSKSEVGRVDSFSDDESDEGLTGNARITFSPDQVFTIPPFSQRSTVISVVAILTGSFTEIVNVDVNDGELKFHVQVQGKVLEQELSLSKSFLDFGMVKKGVCYNSTYSIINESPNDLPWRIKLFKFDFGRGKLRGPLNIEKEGNFKTEKGFLRKNMSCFSENYRLDARKSGLQCALLQITVRRPLVKNFIKKFILVAADVKSPLLSIEASKFENAILAPTGVMYVGEVIKKTITLRNMRNITTSFCWGHSFGCHCRKVNVQISPKRYHIRPRRSCKITIKIMPLDEGIVDHCYIPCFYGRREEPAILSIVGIIEKLHMTFEIFDHLNIPGQESAKPEGKCIVRIFWPLKLFDLTLGKKFLHEDDIREMRCHCEAVSKEMNKRITPEEVADIKREAVVDDVLPDEVETEDANQEESQKRKKPLSSCEMNNKCDFDDATTRDCLSRSSSVHFLEYIKAEMEFRNIPCRTAVSKNFVIRNETTLDTQFEITIKNFPETVIQPEEDLFETKRRIMNRFKRGWPQRLEKSQPLVIVAEPSTGILKGLDSVCITVWVYGDTWGEYRDQALCKVQGTPDFNLRINVQLVGHPLSFPMFDNWSQSVPVYRFGVTRYLSGPVVRNIRVRNSSSIPLNVIWMVFLTHPKTATAAAIQYEFPFENDKSDSLDTQSKNKSDDIQPPRTSTSSPELPAGPGESESKVQEGSVSSPNLIKSTARTSEEQIAPTVVLSKHETLKSNERDISFRKGKYSGIFKIEPAELEIGPHTEKKIRLTLNADPYVPKCDFQELKGTLTGLVNLEEEFAYIPDICFRRCGSNYVTELLTITASIEIPSMSFDILKEDLSFWIDANEVIRSTKKRYSMRKRFLVRNASQVTAHVQVLVHPGDFFRVVEISTIKEVHKNYDPKKSAVAVLPGKCFQAELECTLTYKDVMNAYEVLKDSWKVQASKRQSSTVTKSYGSLTRFPTASNRSKKDNGNRSRFHHPWKKSICLTTDLEDNVQPSQLTLIEKKIGIPSVDSLTFPCVQPEGYQLDDGSYVEEINEFVESEMEELYISEEDAHQTRNEPASKSHVITKTETILLKQKNLIKQSLVAELRISFPMIKVSTEEIDFENVYLKETAIRFFSLFNLTSLSTDYKMKLKGHTPEFSVCPATGKLPATNYNTDNGISITVEFTPSQPGFFKDVLEIYNNSCMEFDCLEIRVLGLGTWNEKYRHLKHQVQTKLPGIQVDTQELDYS